MQNTSTTPGMIGVLFMLIFVAAIVCLVLFIWGSIFRKAGYSFWMALLMLIPLVNLVWLLVFAFSTWPIQRELEALRSGRTGGFPVYPPGSYPPAPPPAPRG